MKNKTRHAELGRCLGDRVDKRHYKLFAYSCYGCQEVRIIEHIVDSTTPPYPTGDYQCNLCGTSYTGGYGFEPIMYTYDEAVYYVLGAESCHEVKLYPVVVPPEPES